MASLNSEFRLAIYSIQPLQPMRFSLLLSLLFPLVALSQPDAQPPHDLALRVDNPGDSITHAVLGVYSRVVHLRGVQMSLFTSAARNKSRGVQLSGLANFGQTRFGGVQAAALFNYTHRLHGMQLSPLANLNLYRASGLQLSGLTNLTNDGRHLVQIALSNIALTSFRGVQLGLANYVGSLRGVQIGMFNLANDHNHGGVQIGLLNATEDTTSIKIGLINLTPQTHTQLMMWTGNTTSSNLAARFLNGRFYTLIGLGAYYHGLSDRFSGSLFYRVGLRQPVMQKWYVTTDIGFIHIEDTEDTNPDTLHRMFGFQAHVGIEWMLHPKCSLFTTTGWNITRHYTRYDRFDHKPLFELGLLLF